MPSIPAIPEARQCQVWIDFDGTITRRDLLDDLIFSYSADDSWKEIERQWQAAEIGSRQCLEFEFALLRISDGELAKVLQAVEFDPGLGALMQLLDEFSIPRAILSDGIDTFIHNTLQRHGISGVPVFSNAIERRGDRMALLCPLARPDCQSGAAHCKCGSLQKTLQAPRRSIYIGDGRSDLCPARRCDVVFAKGALADAMQNENRPIIPFDSLLDVSHVLRRSWQRH